MRRVSKGSVTARDASRLFGCISLLVALVASAATGCGGRLETDDAAPVASASLDGGDPDAPSVRDDAGGAFVDASRADASVDASPRDAADIDGHAPVDSSAPDSASEAAAPPPPTCAQSSALSLPAWKPPTPFHQAACTAGEISTYTSCLGTAGCTSASTPCDACLETDASADAYGPIILGTTADDGFGDAFVNWGGCQANLDGHTQAGSCGSETNAWQACGNEVCPYTTCGAGLDACEDYAYDTACVGHTESDACASEWGTADGGVAECAYFATLATLWCGP